MLGKKTFKAQSAMEYLMTYGWAILIIAVVLGALFSLGVFSGSSLLGTSCIASPGYYCQNPVLATTGLLQFTFGQNTGSPIYNLQIACTATTNAAGYPSTPSAWMALGSTGYAGANSATQNIPLGGWYSNSLSLASGQTVSVSNIPCFGTTGTTLVSASTGGSVAVGQTFSGFIWLNYTSSGANSIGYLSSVSPTTAPPWYTLKVATLTIKVV